MRIDLILLVLSQVFCAVISVIFGIETTGLVLADFGASAAVAAGITAAAAGTSATMQGVRGKKGRAQQQKQWQAEFNEAKRRYDEQAAATERQNAWSREWGNILNQLNAQQGRQAVKLGDEDVKTNKIAQQMERNSMLKQQEAAKNFALGQSRALLNSRRGQGIGA